MGNLVSHAIALSVIVVWVSSMFACGTLAYLGVVVFGKTKNGGLIQATAGALTMAILTVSGLGLATIISYLFVTAGY